MPKRKKKHYDDTIKVKWREVLRKDIEDTVLSNGKLAKDCRVLCMPGEDGYEILQVYDPLGVRRSRITAFEWDPVSARRLRRFGVNVMKADVNHFLRRRDGEKFDIINLDYDDELYRDILYALMFAAKYRRVSDNGFLGLTVVGKREDRYIQQRLKEYALNTASGIDGGSKLDLISLKDAREPGLQRLLLTIFGGTFPTEKLREIGPSNWRRSVEMLTDLVSYLSSVPYFIEDLRTYKYHSEGGSPIVSNFMHLRTYEDRQQAYQSFIDLRRRLKHPTQEQLINLLNREASKLGLTTLRLYEMVRRDAEFFTGANKSETLDEDLPEVVYLGSSAAKPKIKSWREYAGLLKAEIRDRKGSFDINEFNRKLRRETRNTMYSLEAYMAHYKRSGNNRHRARLTAETAYDFLQNGWQDTNEDAPKYIWDYFTQTRHREYVLRGVKARITRENNRQNKS